METPEEFTAEELASAKLFDEFVDALQRGERPEHAPYLERCPASERDGLREALEGAEFIHAHPPAPKMSQKRLDALFSDIKQMQRARTMGG